MVKLKNIAVAVSGVVATLLMVGLPGSSAQSLEQFKTEYYGSTYASTTVSTKKVSKRWTCPNPLAQALYGVGFRGNSLRIAWAISMRESGGHPKEISSTHDYGLFQFNRSAWHSASWWDAKKLLTSDYNINVAYRISQKGHTWYPWDIRGDGKFLGRYTSKSTYLKFKSFYGKYPCAA